MALSAALSAALSSRAVLIFFAVQSALEVQASQSQDVKCSSHEQCLETFHRLSALRQEKEDEALKLLNLAKVASAEAGRSQDRSRSSLARAESAEAEQARWDAKRKALQLKLRMLEGNISHSGEEEAEEAKRQEIAAKIAALQDQKHEKAVSAMPAKERCLEDFASCTAGLVVLQVQRWMSLLHVFNRFYISLACLAIGGLLLVLPPEWQGITFAAGTLVAVPILVGGAFKDFLSLVGSPPAPLVMLAGLLTMALAVAFLWQGADGLRLLMGAGLAMIFGDLILAVSCCFLPLPETLVALVALSLGLLGGAAGLYRQQATQAFAAAMPAALLVAAGAVLLLSAALQEAYLEDVVAALMPWAGSAGDEALGAFFCECGRLLWLILQVPALVHLLRTPSEAYVLPWQHKAVEPREEADCLPGMPPAAEEAPKVEEIDVESAREQPEELQVEAPKEAQGAEEEFWTNLVASRQTRQAPAPEADLDPVATTQLLHRTVEALHALERSLPPQAGEMPATHLGQHADGAS